jgi:hypothetical protein
MAVTDVTSWIPVENGKPVSVQVPFTHLESAQVRWKGKSSHVEASEVEWEEWVVAFPVKPNPFRVTASCEVWLRGGEDGGKGEVRLYTPWGTVKKSSYSLSAGVSKKYTVSESVDRSTVPVFDVITEIWETEGSVDIQSVTTYATTYYWQEVRSGDMSVEVVGQASPGPASLADGVTSDWYALTGLVAGDNSLLPSIAGSGQAEIQIEYTGQPLPIGPTLIAPEHRAISDDRTPSLEFQLNAAAASDATAYHGKITLSLSPSFLNAVTADSSIDQSGWEYWDGAAWQLMPAAGVPAGTTVRYTAPTKLAAGPWYWKTQARDDWGWGVYSEPWILRLVLSVNGVEGYSLSVDGVPYNCTDLEVVETSNGEIGTVRFVISNLPDEDGVRPFSEIDYGATVAVSLYDSTGAEEQYMARVLPKSPGEVTLEITATMGDKVLADRIIREDYLNTDLGTALADIVTKYCSPILATGIPNPFGIVANLPVNGKQAMDAFEEAFKVWGLLFWTETDATDWVAYLADPTALAFQGVYVRYGEGV